MQYINYRALHHSYFIYLFEQQVFFVVPSVSVSVSLLDEVELPLPLPITLGQLQTTPEVTQEQQEQHNFPSTPATWGHLQTVPDIAQLQHEQHTVIPLFDT